MPQQIDVPGMGVVEFPDGMSDADMSAAIKKTMDAKPSMLGDVAKSAAAGIGKGASAIAGLPTDISNILGQGMEWGARKLGVSEEKIQKARELEAGTAPSVRGPGSQDIQKKIETVTGEFHKPETTAGKYAQTAGEFLPGIAMGPGGLLRKAVTNVALPAGASETAGQLPGVEGTAAEPYARVAGAMAGGLAPSALGRVITPVPASPARQRLVDILTDEGVTSLTAGQRTGSKTLRYQESALGDAPFAGGKASAITDRGQEQFTQAAMRRAGGGENAGPEVLSANHTRLTDQFRDLSARNTLVPDNQFITDLTTAVRNYRNVPNSQQRAMIQGYIDDILPYVNSGTMPGVEYQAMRSRMSRQANGNRQSDPDLSDALRGMRNALDNAMGRSVAPADRELWNTTRREYGAQRVIEKAASRAGEATAEGQIVPSNLRNTVAAENRGAFARGQGDFSELARAGAGVMSPMPNSGTAQRSAFQNILNLMTAGAAPAAAGRVLMSPPVQGYLGNQIATPLLNNLNPRQAAVVSALMAAEQQRPQLTQQ